MAEDQDRSMCVAILGEIRYFPAMIQDQHFFSTIYIGPMTKTKRLLYRPDIP